MVLSSTSQDPLPPTEPPMEPNIEPNIMNISKIKTIAPITIKLYGIVLAIRLATFATAAETAFTATCAALYADCAAFFAAFTAAFRAGFSTAFIVFFTADFAVFPTLFLTELRTTFFCKLRRILFEVDLLIRRSTCFASFRVLSTAFFPVLTAVLTPRSP